ncbi:MAG: isocitrate/isopropylmalate family dehydrogenase [Phycisphaeraceae bacterium]
MQHAGDGAHRKLGHPVPAATIESLRRNKVGIKGPLIVPWRSPVVQLPGTEERYATPNAALRGACRAFANVRPARLFPGVPSRFQDVNVDMVVVREVSEGAYLGRERRIDADHAEATAATSRGGSERIARFGFELARKQGRGRVHAIHKANVFDQTDGLFLDAFYDVAKEYTEIEAVDIMIDASMAAMIRDPSQFDVIVAPNQYGDILSDLTAAIVGGLGMGPGANHGAEISVFEACHGAAPDIAGQGIANPMAVILSAAMMLDHLGHDDAATRVRSAVARFFVKGEGLTPDLGGSGTTQGVADRLVELLEQPPGAR